MNLFFLNRVCVELDDISEMAKVHLNASDVAQHSTASLQPRTNRELVVHNLTQKSEDVLRVLEHLRKLCEFITAKAEHRASIFQEAHSVEWMRQETGKFGKFSIRFRNLFWRR